MKKIIHNLRQKPEHHRKKVAITASACITGLIFVLWLSFFRLQYLSPQESEKPVAKDNGPVLILKENVAAIYKSFDKDIFSFKKSFQGGGAGE